MYVELVRIKAAGLKSSIRLERCGEALAAQLTRQACLSTIY